jgi:hypothetical protein
MTSRIHLERGFMGNYDVWVEESEQGERLTEGKGGISGWSWLYAGYGVNRGCF